eukprot:Nk52_evm2s2350 gene=Nk52_evmTU2s2350
MEGAEVVTGNGCYLELAKVAAVRFGLSAVVGEEDNVANREVRGRWSIEGFAKEFRAFESCWPYYVVHVVDLTAKSF